jgi:hypothetical protein
VDEDVVDSDAGLSAVQELPEEDAVDCRTNFGSLIDDDWALPAEFKDAGDEVLCCFDGHESAGKGGPCEADDVHW